MGALRQSVLNLGICQEDEFGENNLTKFSAISVFTPENGEVDIDLRNMRQLSEKELVRPITQELPPLSQTGEWHQRLAKTVKETPGLFTPKPQGTTATLNVIYVDNEEDSVRGMARDTFMKLFDTFGLDRTILHFLSRGADTWHCIRRDDETCAFLLIIQSLYYMACGFSPRGRETTYVIFGRPPKEIEDDLDTTNFNFYQSAWFYEQSPAQQSIQARRTKDIRTLSMDRAFEKLLAKIKCYHLHHPLSLVYLGLVNSLSSIFIRVEKEVETIGKLEDRATERVRDDGKTLDSLLSLSEKASRASVTMAGLSKATGVASMLLQTRSFPTKSGSQYARAAEWLAEGLPSCRQILENEKLQIQSQDKGSKLLHRFRADAQSGLTIAVMTMTFLPATSIAATTAVPWDRDGQRVQALQAIVYCVVTFFMTIAVFLIWMRGAPWLRRGATWFSSGGTWLKNGARNAKRFMSDSIRSSKAAGTATDV